MATIVDTAHWRDSAREPRFFVINARAVFPLFMWILHARMWTFWIAIIGISFFVILERFGFTPTVFGRWLKNVIAGNIKSARPWWR